MADVLMAQGQVMQIVRRFAYVLILVLTLVVGAAAAAAIVSQTSWFKNWLRGYIVREANRYLNGTLSIERLGGNLFFGVEMENIGVSLNGAQVVAVEAAGQFREEGMLGIGGDAFDHELLARDPQREGGSLLQELLRPSCHPGCRGGEQGVPLRIHGVFVQGDRQLNEEIGELPRERGTFRRRREGRRRGAHGVPQNSVCLPCPGSHAGWGNRKTQRPKG